MTERLPAPTAERALRRRATDLLERLSRGEDLSFEAQAAILGVDRVAYANAIVGTLVKMAGRPFVDGRDFIEQTTPHSLEVH